jgi:alkylation response protein AidB-like acyl-CoA dehydrogenase
MTIRVETASAELGKRPSHEEVVARASALVPRLRERAEKTEALRRLPDETMEDLAASALFGLGSPLSDGGLGGGIRELGDVTRILAQGCASTAWVYGFYQVHHTKMVLSLPPAGREAVMAGRPYGLCASSAGFHAEPSGTAVPVDGGWRLSGKWPFASGVMNCDWVFIMTNLEQAGETKPIGLAVPIADMTVHDVWQWSGMRGTGSNTVSADEVFVPDAFVWRVPDAPAEPEATTREDFPLGGVSPLRIFDVVLPAVAVGIAEAAIEQYKTNTHQRIVAFGVGPQIEHREAWERYAEAWSWVNLASLLWQKSVEQMEELATKGEKAPVETAAQLRLASSRICRLARDAVQTMMDGAGSSVHHTSHPLQRAQRDLDVLKSHNYLHWDGAATQSGQAMLGLEPYWLITA